jgi:RHS repeat-associated protein
MSGIGKRVVDTMSTRYTAFLLLVLLLQFSGLASPIGRAQAQNNNAGPPYSYVPVDRDTTLDESVGPFPSLQSAIQSSEQRLLALDGPSGTNPKASCHLIYSPYTFYYAGLQGFVEYAGNPGNTQYCQLGANDFSEVEATYLNYDPGKNAGGCDCDGGNGHKGATSAGTSIKSHPINTATGNKFEQETDYQAPNDRLTLRRFYNGLVAVAPTSLGTLWRHSFDRSLIINSTTSINLFRPDGRYELFLKANGVWAPGADVADTLTEQDDTSGNPTGYTVIVAAALQSEQYSPAGLLQSIADQSGTITTLTYSTASTPVSVASSAGLLLTVIDPSRRTLSFTYNTSGQLATVTQPDGGVLTYGYDTSGNLNSVQYPDGKTRQYTYNESALTGGANLPGLLTGTIDESGTRYESTTYNSNGLATSVYLGAAGAGIDLTTLVYGATAYDGTTPATLTTPLGAVTNLSYQNALGALKVSGSSAPCGATCNQPWSAQTYDANGYPQSTTDFNGNITQTTYDATGLLDQQIDASGTTNQRTTATQWNSYLRLPVKRTVTDANGVVKSLSSWVYNNRGQPWAECEMDPAVSAAASYSCSNTGSVPTGVRRWTHIYCENIHISCPIIGLILSTTGPRTDLTQTTTYAYYTTTSATNCGTPGAACYKAGDLKTISDALGHVTTIASYDGAGRITRMIDANGVNTDSTYSPRGWPLTLTVGGATTTLTYTAYGAVQTLKDADGFTTTYGYDTAHRLTDITDTVGNNLHYTLDAAGDKTAEQAFNTSKVAVRSLARTFNTLGQLTGVTDGLSQTVFNASYSDSYDGNGNLTHVADALGIQQKGGYDALNRLVSTIQNYSGTDTATQNTTTVATLDALDRTTNVQDPTALNTAYTYDGLSNATTLISPDTGTSTDTFDAAGNRLAHTDAKGIVSTSTYDALDRPTGTTYVDTTANVSYTYDEANAVTGCASSSPIGRLTRVIENTVTTVYCYDSHGNVLQKSQTASGFTDVTQYAFSPGDRLRTMTAPGGTLTTYGHDTDGRVSSITVKTSGASSASNVATSITWLPFGPVSRYTLGNGQVVTRTYDANYRVTDVTSPALALHFALDATGDITALGAAAGANPATETYHYDPLYRLKDATEANGAALESYTYNSTGDRLSKTASGLATGAYLYTTGTHQLSSVGNTARANDANGNTTGDIIGGSTYGFAYDSRNRLTLAQANGATVAAYIYNVFGQRIGKGPLPAQVMTERYAYNEASGLIGEYGATNRDYIWLGNLPVAVIDNTINGSVTTSTINYVHADGLGTPRAVTNSAGATIWQWAYVGNPFGEQPPTSSAGYVLNLRFPGQYYDAETGLIHNDHRDYCAACGRYIESDPIGLNGGVSTFSYTSNNPLNYFDSSGLDQQSSPLLLALVPGQGAWDAAVTSWQHGSYGMAMLYGADMLGEQALYVATLGQGQVAETGAKCLTAAATKSPAAARVFWSGGKAAQDAAEQWAVANGANTLEMTAEGQSTEAAAKGLDWLTQARPMWVDASQKFASSASGEINVFQGSYISTQSVWATTEYPALMANPNVTNIVYHGVGW